MRSDGDGKRRYTTSRLVTPGVVQFPADNAGHAVLGIYVEHVAVVETGDQQRQPVLGHTQSDRRRRMRC